MVTIIIIIIIVIFGGIIAFPFLKRILGVFSNPIQIHDKTPESFNIPFKEVWIPTKNDCSLYGWWIPGSTNKIDNNDKSIVLVHGWGRNVGRMLPYIEVLHHAGFNLLTFDSRNHGSSDSDRYSTMLKFAQDIHAVVDFLERSYCDSSITLGVIGLSIGGGAALYAASLDTRIMKLVTVGALGDPKTVIRSQLIRNRIKSRIIQSLLFKYLEYKIGISFEELAPINRVQEIRAEMMIIHGENDEVVPVRQAHQLAENGNPDRIQLWVMPGRGHSDCHEHSDFWKSITYFFHNN